MSKCALIPKAKNGDDSVLFQDLLTLTHNRLKAIKLYYTLIASPEFRQQHPDLVLDKNKEPKIFENQYVMTSDGVKIPLLKNHAEYESVVSQEIKNSVQKLSEKLFNGLSPKFKRFINRLGYMNIKQEFSWRRFFKGTVQALKDEKNVSINNANAVHTIGYILDHYLSQEEKHELLKIHGIDAATATHEDLDTAVYKVATSFLIWRSNQTNLSQREIELFNEIKDTLGTVVENEKLLDKYFGKLSGGFATYNISVPDLSVRAGEFMLQIYDDYGTPYDSVSDAVARFKKAQEALRGIMHDFTTNAKTDKGKYYFSTREESERRIKRSIENLLEESEDKIRKKFRTLNPDPSKASDADRAIIEKYYMHRAVYKNFDFLLNMLYPGKTTRTVNPWEEAYREELDEVLSEISETSGTDVNINAETVGSEHINSERSQSAAVKDFLSTIRKHVPEGADKSKVGFVRPRYAYLLTAKLLSGLDYNNPKFTENVINRSLELGGWSKTSDVYMIAQALTDLVGKAQTRHLHTGYRKNGTYDYKLIPEGTKLGHFESEYLYVGSNGKLTQRVTGESTVRFYDRIEKEHGITNLEVAVAGQQLVMGSLLSSVYSHFASMKEADYHYLEVEEEDFTTVVKYRKGKYQGVGEAVRQNIKSKIEESVQSGFYEKAVSEAFKEKTPEAKLDRFLREIGLSDLANQVNEHMPRLKVIATDIQKSVEHVERAKKKFRLLESSYNKYMDDYASLSEDFIAQNKALVYQVISSEREAEFKKRQISIEEKMLGGLSVESIKASESLRNAQDSDSREMEVQLDTTGENPNINFDDLTSDQKKIYHALKNKFAPKLVISDAINTMVNNITEALTRNNENMKPSSVFSKGKSKKYTMQNASNAWYIINQVIQNFQNIGKTLTFTTEDFYKKNLFLSGFNSIEQWHDFDYTKNIDWIGRQIDTSYSDDRMTGFFMRQFNGMFIDTLQFNSNKEGTYVQAFPTISNRPSSYGVRVKAMSKEGIIQGLVQTIHQLQLRPLKAQVNAKIYNENSTVLFKVLEPYLEKYEGKIKSIPEKDIESIARSIYENNFRQIALELAQEFVDMKIPLHNKIVNPSIAKLIEPSQQSAYEKLANRPGAKTQAVTSSNGSLQYAFTAEDLLPVMHVFVANNYLNTFHLVQLTMGDPAYFKSGADLIKRASGAHAPGQVGRVHDKFAMAEKFKALVVKDQSVNTTNIKSFLESLGFEGKELEKQLNLYPEEYEPTDGFGVMLPKRRKDLVKGYGQEYGVTHISKPAHYEITRSGGVMMKYSSLELTDELCAVYPMLSTLRKRMEALEADELVFASAVKVGQPVYMPTVDTLLDESFDPATFNRDAILELSNKYYRLQHNPYHNLDSSVAYPTQLAYFLNVLGENTRLADKVYKATANILERRLNRIMNLKPEALRAEILHSMKGAGNDRFRELLESGISLQFPEIAKQSFTKLSAMFKNQVTSIRFNNSQKLVAQSDLGITKLSYDNGITQATTEPLRVIKTGGRMVAECLIPKGALPPEIEKAVMERLKGGEEVFLSKADALAFRIPSSELHSAIALRVAGFLDPMNLSGKNTPSNMLIVPKDLMPIIGYDFDIDSFFVIQRQYVVRDGKKVYPGYPDSENGNWKFSSSLDTEMMEDDEFEAYQKNIILDSFLEAITREGDTIKRMTAPISFKLLQDDISDLQDIVGKQKDFDLSNPLDNYRAFESSFSGAKGVGIFAQAVKALAYMVRSNNGESPSVHLNGRHVQVTYMGKALNQIDEGKDQDMTLWASMDSLLNSALDNVKLQILPRLNIGDNTFKAMIALRALGVDMKTANRFMLLPFMKHINRLRTKQEVTRAITSLLNARNIDAVKNFELKEDHKYIIDIDDTLLDSSFTIEAMDFSPLAGKSKKESFFMDHELYSHLIPEFESKVSLTSLGKQLQEKIKDGTIDPTNIKLVSNAKGREVFLSGLLGIPKENILSGITNSEKSALYKKDKEYTLIDDKLGVKVSTESQSVDINMQEIEKWLKVSSENGIESINDIVGSGNQHLINAMADYASAYLSLTSVGDAVSDLANYLNIIRSLPVTNADMQKMLDLRNRIFEQDGSVSSSFPLEIGDFMKVNPHIEKYNSILSAFWGRIQSTFTIHSAQVEAMIEEVSKLIRANMTNQELSSSIKENYEEFLITTLEDFPEFKWDEDFEGYDHVPEAETVSGVKVNGKEAYKLHVLKMVDKLKKQVTDNKFLSALAITSDFRGRYLQMPGIHNLEYEDIIDLRAWFNRLSGYSYDFSSGKIITQENGNIQNMLLRYAILQYGLKFSTKNFSLIFPPELLKPVDKAYNRAVGSQRNFEGSYFDFALQYALKNPESVRTTSKNITWSGYDPEFKAHFDIRLSGAKSFDQIIRVEGYSNTDKKVKAKYYWKTNEHSSDLGSYALYVEVAQENESMNYQGGISRMLHDRFNEKVKNFKVAKNKDVSVISAKYAHVQPGDIVSLNEFTDPLRLNLKYYRVQENNGRTISLEPANEPVEPDFVEEYKPQIIDIKSRRSETFKNLIRILDKLSLRTGIQHEVLSESEMEKLTGRKDIRGAFRGGVVYINSSLVSEDTPFHEFLHPFVRQIKLVNPHVYETMVNEIKTSVRGKEVLSFVSRVYTDLSEQEKIEEAIVTLAGQYAAAVDKTNFVKGLGRALERLWNSLSAYVGDLLGKKISAKALQEITIRELGTLFALGEGQIEMSVANGSFDADSRIQKIYDAGKDVIARVKPDGTEEDHYILPSGRKVTRITSFMENFLNRRSTDKTKSIAERRADKLWKDITKDTKLDTDLAEGKALTYHEYVERLTAMYEKGRIKGKMIHKMIQLSLEPDNADRIANEMEELNAGGIVKSWEYRWVSDIVGKLLLKYGIHVDAKIPESERDKVKSEVTVFNEDLGIGGTMDMLIEHTDGTYSIIDWKSGVSFNSRLFDNLLKYGDQIIDITDNPKERAKLQVALYAVLLRANNPEIKFRDLRVAWIPGEWQALQDDPTSYVEVDSYIPLIEQFFHDRQALKQAGIDPDVLQRIDPNSSLFRISAYSSYSSSSIDDLIKQGRSLDQIFEIKLNRLQEFQAIIDSDKKGIKALSDKEKDEYFKVVKDVAELKKDPSIDLKNALDSQNDISLFTRTFGHAGDVSNPLVRVWNKLRNERSHEASKEYYKKINTLRALLEKVNQEMINENGYIESRQLGIMTGNYKQMYAWAYKYDQREGRHKIKRFITKQDSEFNSLSQSKQQLLNYVNDTIGEYFLQKDSYLNQGVLEVDTKTGKKTLSHLELMNRYTNDMDKIDLFYGFMPKVAATDEEIRYKFGNGNSMIGAFNPTYIKDIWKRSTTFYEENNYEKWDVHEQALPIKFVGSMEIEAREDYSDNLELIFSRWVQAMEHKKNMDHVYALGKGIYNMMMDAPEKDRLTSLASFMDDILTKDVQGKMKVVKYTTKGLRTMDTKGMSHSFSVDKLLMFLNRWSSSVVMQFRPYTATGNTIQGLLLESRRGAVGSIAKFNGIDGNYIDYTASDMAVAQTQYLNLMMDAATGNLRSNKLYMLAKELNYHPTSSMYAHSREFITMRNRLLDESNQYILHNIGEEYLAYMVMAAQLNHMKLIDGRTVLDAYQVVEGGSGQPMLKWTGGVRGYVISGSGSYQTKVPLEGITSQEAAKMRRVYENQQGSYRREELAAIEVYALGKMFTSLKRYLHRILFIGLSGTKPDDLLGYYEKTGEENNLPVYEWHARMVEGRYWVIGKAILAAMSAGHMFNQYTMKNMKKNDPEAYLSTIDAMLTVAMLSSAYLAYALMFQDTDDDDIMKKFWKRYFVDNPSQMYNPVDILRNPTQLMPVAMTRVSNTAVSFSTMMGALVMYGVSAGDINKLYTQRGDLKGWNDFKKGIPYIAPYTDFLQKMENQQMLPWEDDDNFRSR